MAKKITDFENDFNSDFDIDIPDLFSDFEIDISKKFSNRYIVPGKPQQTNSGNFKIAQDLAAKINLSSGNRQLCITDGTFIFGDFIEALIVGKKLKVKRLLISTLALNQNNIDSFNLLMKKDYVQNLDLIVSHYWFANYQNLVEYSYDLLDTDNRFQLAVASSHCKVILIECEDGKKISIHGSANLRSSANIEQMDIEIDNFVLYDFLESYQDRIIGVFKTILKPLRRKKLWQTIINK